MTTPCPLCSHIDSPILWQNHEMIIIDAQEPDYPGFCRVIWRDHVREMSDLTADEQQRLMALVFTVERALRSHFTPDKINLASFGNQVPHIHWHVIPRFNDDRHFPNPVWASAPRDEGYRPRVTSEELRDLINSFID